MAGASQGEKKFAWILTAVYLCAALVPLLRHEMWRDELQHWMIARDSRSPAELAAHLRYDRNPKLWAVILFGLSRVSSSPAVMQAAHLLAAALGVYLLARGGPFSRTAKTLLAFGYYLLFEYALIARPYVLGVLGLILFARVYPQRLRRLWPLGLVLALMANTSTHAFIAAAGLGAALVLEWAISWPRRRQTADIFVFLLIAFGLALAFVSMLGPPDAGLGLHPETTMRWDPLRLRNVLMIVPRAYLPLPDFRLNFWDTTLLDRLPAAPAVQVALGLLVLAGAAAFLWKKPYALAAFAAGTTGLLGFFYLANYGVIRHHGFLFFVFLACLWMARSDGAGGERSPGIRRDAGLIAVLAVQCAGGLFAAAMDVVHPFSQAKATARILERRGLAAGPIAGDSDYSASAVAGFLGRPIFYPRGDREGTFVLWDKKRNEALPEGPMIERVKAHFGPKAGPVVLVLSTPLSEKARRDYGIEEIGRTPPAIVADEAYVLYAVRFEPCPNP